MDWRPPAGFTADVLPVVYRGFNDTNNIQLYNGARLGDGKVNKYLGCSRVLYL